jgi:L-alanine-DL-glutamate epimerase-like enolase superfamily enzyme
MICVAHTNSNFEREPMLAPFGFKGGYLTELWQTVALISSHTGCTGIGLGTQSSLWSDASIFLQNPESVGNSIMYLMTAYALKQARGMEFDTPIDLLDKLLPITYEYGKAISGNPNLRLTYALNALVAVDNAAWQLYMKENKINSFDGMIPPEIRPALLYKHKELASIPLMSYGVSLNDINGAVDDGYFFLKIKIGSDPDKDGDQEKMLAWDMARLSSIHKAVKDRCIPYTEDGHIPYYLDANGRYNSKDRLLRLLDYADKIGALERIILLEEPFPEECHVDVRDVPVRLAADESAHSDADAALRIDMGYGAIALKPIAKTMSMSLKIARIAHERNIPCFCADLTVNPVLVDWNKNVAARLMPLPGMKIGVIETNGHQNYLNWKNMASYHPCAHAPWTKTVDGVFHLDEDFYKQSGGILLTSSHYSDMVK